MLNQNIRGFPIHLINLENITSLLLSLQDGQSVDKY